MGLLLTAAIIAAPSLLALLALAWAGVLPPAPALVAGLFDTVAALAFAAWRAQEHREIAQAVRRSAHGPVARPGRRDRLTRDIVHVARVQGERSESLLRQLRTEESIIETLPDPLVMSNYFGVRDGRIVSLAVVRNTPSPY